MLRPVSSNIRWRRYKILFFILVACTFCFPLHVCCNRSVSTLLKYVLSDDNTFRRGKMPIIVPFVLTTATSVACTAFTLVDHEAAIYLSFVMFTFYRSYVYSYEVTYISDA